MTALQVGPCQEGDGAVLMRFGFGQFGPGAQQCGLDCLGGELIEECWQADGALTLGQVGDVHWRQAGDHLFLVWEQPDDPRLDPAVAAEDGYRQLLAVAGQRDCRQLLRAWNFMPAINQGDGDSERYRRFCLGRARALEAAGIHDTRLCAGTAIGGNDPVLRVHLLAGTRAGIHIENPRQVSAFRYPRIYGPRSPSFARATALPRPDGSVLLMISGTASVVGHETVHVGDLAAQTDEIIANMDALLEESVRRLGRPGLRTFGANSLFRVYVRRAEDWPAARQRLARAWPRSLLVGLRGDICRSDLLLEVEAVTAA